MIAFSEGTAYTQPLSFEDESGETINLSAATALTARIYNYPREGSAVVDTMTEAADEIDIAADGLSINVKFTVAQALEPGTYTIEFTATLSSDVVFLGRRTLKVFSSHALGG
jgi:hypothetical protein